MSAAECSNKTVLPTSSSRDESECGKRLEGIQFLDGCEYDSLSGHNLGMAIRHKLSVSGDLTKRGLHVSLVGDVQNCCQCTWF